MFDQNCADADSIISIQAGPLLAFEFLTLYVLNFLEGT